MFGKVLDILDKPVKDNIHAYAHTDKHFNLIKNLLGATVMLTMVMLVFNVWFYQKYKEYKVSPLYQVSEKTLKNGTYNKAQLILLDAPRQTPEVLARWATTALNNIYEFSFRNITRRGNYYSSSDVEKAREYFSPAGYAGYLEALDNTSLLEKLYENKQNTRFLVTDPPLLIGSLSGVYNEDDGKLYWQMQAKGIKTTTSGRTVSEVIYADFMVVLDTSNGERTGFFIDRIEMRNK